MFKLIASCVFVVGFSCAADAPVNGPKSILKKVELTDMPEIIVADHTYSDSEKAKSLFDKIDYPEHLVVFLNPEIHGAFKKRSVLADPKSDLLKMHDTLDRWAINFINQSKPEAGNDPIFPVLTAQTLVQYYLPKSYLILIGLTYELKAHPVWINALYDTLLNFIMIHNIADKTYSKDRVESDVFYSLDAGGLAYNITQTLIDLKIYDTPKYKTDSEIEKKKNPLQVTRVNTQMRDMFDRNNRMQELALALVELTPESMNINDAMTLYEVFLAWSELNGNSFLELNEIAVVVDALIERNVRLSSGDPYEDGLTFDDYVKEFANEVNQTSLTVRGVKRPRLDESYSLLDLYADDE